MKEKVIGFLAGKLSCPQEEINEDMILTGMGVTSLELFSMVVDMEKYFGIQFSDRELGSFVTVGDVVCAVEKKVICQGKTKQ